MRFVCLIWMDISEPDTTLWWPEHTQLYNDVREQVLEPHTRHFITVKFKEGLQGGDCNFEVTNFVVAPDKGLRYTIKL